MSAKAKGSFKPASPLNGGPAPAVSSVSGPAAGAAQPASPTAAKAPRGKAAAKPAAVVPASIWDGRLEAYGTRLPSAMASELRERSEAVGLPAAVLLQAAVARLLELDDEALREAGIAARISRVHAGAQG